jgi:hypothetical protein
MPEDDGADRTDYGTPRFRDAADGLQNTMSGLGTSSDKRSGNSYAPTLALNRMQLENLWRGNWTAKKIITLPVDDMLSPWVSTQWDDKGKANDRQQLIDDAEDQLNVRECVQEALHWSRMYGGSGIIVGVKGQDNLEEPLELDSIGMGSIEYLLPVDRWQIGATDLMNQPEDLNSPNFRKPRFFALGTGTDLGTARVHWSRIIIFRGRKLPWFSWLQNGMWDDSELQHIYSDLMDYSATMALLATMFFEANIDVMQIDKLAETLALPGGEAKIRRRFGVASEIKSANKMLMLDALDKYEKKGNNFSGLGPVVQEFKSLLCGIADIPATRFWGKSPDGMNSTGDGDMNNYNKRLKGDQDAGQFRRPFNYLYQILGRHALGSIPKGWKVEWNPLSQESSIERATREKMQADTRRIYYDMGAVTAYLVAKQLKEDDTFSMMDDEDVEDVGDMEEAMGAERAAALLTGSIGPEAKPGESGAQPGVKNPLAAKAGEAEKGKKPLEAKTAPEQFGNGGEGGE